MTDRELMQMALDALKRVKDMQWSEDSAEGRLLIKALRARLALHDMNKAAEHNVEGL